MKVSKYLIITRSGNLIRMVNNITNASVKHNEFAIKLNLEIPNSVFNRFFPTINAELGADSFVKPEAKVEIEEVDDKKIAEKLHATFEAQGEDFTLDEIKEFIKNKRGIEQFKAFQNIEQSSGKGDM